MSEIKDVLVSPHITLKMQSMGRGSVRYRIRRTMPLVKLRDAYCSQMGLPKELTFISFDGDKISDAETADSLLLEENDLLDVFVKHQSEAGDGAALVNSTLSA